MLFKKNALTIAAICLLGSVQAELLEVNSTLDDSAYDPTISASINPPSQRTVITLRSALERSFFNGEAEDFISFDISKHDSGYHHSTRHWIIEPQSSYLPVFGKKVIIDGFTQKGSKPNSHPMCKCNNSELKIELRGTGPGAERDPNLVPDGIDFLFADGSEVRGLIVNNFARYYAADDSNDDFGASGLAAVFTNNFSLKGCFFGTDVTGTENIPNLNAFACVSSTNSLIGGPNPEDRNLFSGSYTGLYGIVQINGSADIAVKGNTFGVDRSGEHILQPDGRLGINLVDSLRVVIGGDSISDRNIISGGRTYNIIISPGDPEFISPDYVIKNNFIGTNLKGTKGFGERNGVGVWASQTTRLSIEDNLISGNAKGIVIGSNSFGHRPCDSTTIERNIIGLNACGTKPLGNELHGVLVAWAQNTLISHNVISANGGNGIQTGVAAQTSILHNRIGTDKEGHHRMGNGHNGIQLGTLVAAGIPSQDDVVEGNLIVGNHANGVEVRSHATNELISHNCIVKNRENGVQVLCSDAIVTNNKIKDNDGSTVVIGGVVTSP